MNKAELESKHLAELHELAAKANVPRYRMLRRAELIEKLADGGGDTPPKREGSRGEGSERRERPPRRRRERPAERERSSRERSSQRDRPAGRQPRSEPATQEATPESPPEPASAPQPAASAAEEGRPKRRRRRRRFGRKSKGLRVHDLLLPPPGRQALVYGEGREVCTALLREIASELGGASEGPDPIALLVDPSPEELADWKREAPEAELVVAAQARHASDALAQAVRRAESGEDMILLVDSLTRLDDAEAAKAIFDSGLTQATGSLTVVAALERQKD
jgi:Rho termination factor-like protein